MEKTWKPTAGGILAIIAGAPPALIGTIGAVALGFAGGLAGIGVSSVIFVPLIVLGIVAIVGGIYALRRRMWRLALAGSICALILAPINFVTLLVFWVLISLGGSSSTPTIPDALLYAFMAGSGIIGILAIIFIRLGKREFK